MRRIIYVAKLDSEKSHGVKNKIINQVKSWNRLSSTLDVLLVIIVPNRSHIPNSNDDSIYITEETFFKKYVFNFALFALLQKKSPELIYLRFSILPIINLIGILRYKNVIELNTRFEFEIFRFKNHFKRILLKIYYEVILRLSDARIGVTPECIPIPGSKDSVIGNSISVDKNFYRIDDGVRKNSMELVFIGSPDCSWHGVDKIVKMAKDLDGYIFNIVGYDDRDLMCLGVDFIPPNVHLHGYLSYEEYVKIFSKCFVAIGSLAMERNRMFFSSSLKNREYLVHGLPVVMQGVDVDLLNLDSVFFLKTQFNSNDFRIGIERLRFSAPKYDQLVNSIDSVLIEKSRIDFLLNV